MHPIPKIIAHRGLSERFPENTLSAFKACVQHGIQAVEFDIQLSRDKVPVIFHDRDFKRISGTEDKIHELSLDELSHLDIGGWFSSAFHSERLLTFEQFIQFFKNKFLFLIEIKNREGVFNQRLEYMVEEVIRLLSEYDLEHSYLLSFDTDILTYIHQQAPELSTIQNLDISLGNNILSFVHYVTANIEQLNEQYASLIQNSGKPLLVYCCDNEAQITRAKQFNAVAMMSNRADWLSQWMSIKK